MRGISGIDAGCQFTTSGLYHPWSRQTILPVLSLAEKSPGVVNWQLIPTLLMPRTRSVAVFRPIAVVQNRPRPIGPVYWQVNRPCGSGFVQLLVTPSWVITTFAVADPS